MTSEGDRKLTEWLDRIDMLDAVPWDRLPELDLYMDQVITLMNKQLAPLSVDNDRPLTSSMINNYVKDGVMPRPHQKKYNREHLTALSMICMLKSVFTLPQIKDLLEGLSAFEETEKVYDNFRAAEQTMLRRAAERLRGIDEMSEVQRYLLALHLGLEANANRIVAVKLLESLLPEESAEDKKDAKKKEKEKDKDKSKDKDKKEEKNKAD